jgi:hypothetical protein
MFDLKPEIGIDPLIARLVPAVHLASQIARYVH